MKKMIKIINILLFTIFVFSFNLIVAAYHQHQNDDQFLTVNLLRAVVDRMSKDYPVGYTEIDQPDLAIKHHLSPMKDDEDTNYSDILAMGDDNNIMGLPSIRDTGNEYLQQSSLWGHQFMAGGAGESEQNLKPKGTVPNKNEVKTDAVLPAYCNPPNPCPVGFTAEDRCIENFENTASFSREYQAEQKCMCDSEHMFECQSETPFPYGNDLNLEQIIQGYKSEQDHKDSNMKKAGYLPEISNPYLQGEMLPIAAKKGINVGY